MYLKKLSSWVLVLLLSSSFLQSIDAQDPKFDGYWGHGDAEITSFELEQARYGEIRKGQAVQIFVTEDFSRSKQVKLDQPETKKLDAVKILKMNLNKKFNTGLYDYSMMQSVFTPVDEDKYPYTMKTTTSIQDWCGQTFTQVNLQAYRYKVSIRSYFESEGDVEEVLEQAILEDEIWNRIRLNPEELPTGEFAMIPSAAMARLIHKTPVVTDVEASNEKHKSNSSLMTYTVKFLEPERVLAIDYHKTFPHHIVGWKETYEDNGKKLTTKATKKATLMIDYWNKNSSSDSKLRKVLKLDEE
ncbi:MAG: hypothetical protein GY810_13230 [Aureispira sp.]|nr:hypothetical protein [Aureispira sp.]